MNGLIRGAIGHPIAVLAIVLSMILFGVASLQTIPIQMTPDIDKPVLQVRVSWPGASPKDVEQEVVLRLERELTGLSGVQSVESNSRRGQARVTLTYSVGQDMDSALVKLLGQLARVSGLPSDARQAGQRSFGPASGWSASGWLRLPHALESSASTCSTWNRVRGQQAAPPAAGASPKA